MNCLTILFLMSITGIYNNLVIRVESKYIHRYTD